jgi:hypothetical protein
MLFYMGTNHYDPDILSVWDEMVQAWVYEDILDKGIEPGNSNDPEDWEDSEEPHNYFELDNTVNQFRYDQYLETDNWLHSSATFRFSQIPTEYSLVFERDDYLRTEYPFKPGEFDQLATRRFF